MRINDIEKRLREKERELWADMSRTESEARDLGGPGIQTGAESAENKEAVFQETTADWQVYNQVRDALQRIKDGTYGTCIVCGQRIDDDRLDSVPWTGYCLQHQEQRDRQSVLKSETL